MINHFILHEIKKTKGIKDAIFSASTSEVEIDETATSLVTDLHEAISKSPRKVYGIFSNAGTSYFHQELDAYLSNRSYLLLEKSKYFIGDENSNSLLSLINQETLATGGHILLIDYNNTTSNFLIFAMINNRSGRSLDIIEGVPKLTKTEQVDFKELDLACRIDLTKYRATTSGENYLCFISNREQISNYFVDYIGCEKFNQNRDNSRKLVSAISELTKNETNKEELKKRAFQYCESRLASNSAIDIFDLSEYVFGSSERSKIVDYANQLSLNIDHTFSMSRPEMKKFISFKFKGDWIENLSFDRSHIDDNIVINSETNEVTLRNVGKLVEELRNESR